MEYKITITCRDAAELADVASRLTAADITLDAPDRPAEAPQAAPAARADNHPAPTEKAAVSLQVAQTVQRSFDAAAQAARAEAPQPAPDAPAQEVTLAMIQAVGRKLVAAQRSAEVQKVLQSHGVRLMSKLPADSYPAVYAELNALLEGKDHAPA